MLDASMSGAKIEVCMPEVEETDVVQQQPEDLHPPLHQLPRYIHRFLKLHHQIVEKPECQQRTRRGFSCAFLRSRGRYDARGDLVGLLRTLSIDEVFITWMAFGGNTLDLGSFEEETDKITDLHQIYLRFMHTVHGDGVTGIERRRRDLYGDGARNLATASGRLEFEPRREGFPSGARKEWGLSSKAKVRVLQTTQLDAL
ncbi:hypothetical protein Tco_1123651 [Tanacetum coccineum]|uniref:Uncharacterized protein n=1 Tax=Tanacetum coccineum TaxID=301880 RepID=A0ABQ5J520_9ASTR